MNSGENSQTSVVDEGCGQKPPKADTRTPMLYGVHGSNEEINCCQMYTNHEVPDAISENQVKNPIAKDDTQTEFHNVAASTSSVRIEDLNMDKMAPCLGGHFYGENTSARGNTKRHKGQGKQTDFKQKERHDCYSNSSNTPQPEVTSKDLEGKKEV